MEGTPPQPPERERDSVSSVREGRGTVSSLGEETDVLLLVSPLKSPSLEGIVPFGTTSSPGS